MRPRRVANVSPVRRVQFPSSRRTAQTLRTRTRENTSFHPLQETSDEESDYEEDYDENDTEGWIYENMADEDVMPEMSKSEKAQIQKNIMENLRAKADEALRIDEERLANRNLDPKQKERCENFNKTCKYQPLEFEDWCEHPEAKYYGPDSKDRCFDVEELLQFFENSLTAKKNGNPYPQYPHDPFDRSRFTIEELAEIGDSAMEAGVDVDSIAPNFVRFLEWCSSLTENEYNAINGQEFTYDTMSDVVEVLFRE